MLFVSSLVPVISWLCDAVPVKTHKLTLACHRVSSSSVVRVYKYTLVESLIKPKDYKKSIFVP